MKATRLAIPFLLVLALLFGLTASALAAEADDPSFSIAMEDGSNGGYKLVVTACASQEIGNIATTSIAISFDNSVIAPIDKNTGQIITAPLSNQYEPFSTKMSSGIAGVAWKVSATTTTFDVSPYRAIGQDMSSGFVILEFNFALKEGKTTADMNENTFSMATNLSNKKYSVMLGARVGGAMYYYGRTDGETDTITLTSFTYTNSKVKAPVPVKPDPNDPNDPDDPDDPDNLKDPKKPTTQNNNRTEGTSLPEVTTSTYKPMASIYPAGTVVDATKTNDPLILNSKETLFPAVKIDGWNWLKLRDFAMLLNGSEKQFSIAYSESTGIIDIHTNKTYQPLGNELTDELANIENAISSLQSLRINGEFVDAAAFNIKGFNYLRLRDLAILLNFAIIYEDTTKQITLDFANPYWE